MILPFNLKLYSRSSQLMSSADVNNHIVKSVNVNTVNATSVNATSDETITLHVVMKYNDYTSLEFTEVMSVMVWIWTVALLAQVIVVNLLDQWKPSSSVQRFISSTNVIRTDFLLSPCSQCFISQVIACAAAYTAAVASASWSSSCTVKNGPNVSPVDSYSDDAAYDDILKFCDKVR